MDKNMFVNMEVNVLCLNHGTGEYEEIGLGNINELFFNTHRLKDVGLFYFNDFNYDTVNNEIAFLKDEYELDDDEIMPNDEYFMKIFEKNKNIKLNSINDVLVYGANDSGYTYYMNLSSCINEVEALDKLNNLVGHVCGKYPSPKGVNNEIVIKLA